jgi:hypothetical protein
MSYDSLYQYEQVLGNAQLTNLHPPIMIYLWRLTNHVVAGPGGLLLLHQLIYWMSLFLFAGILSRNWWKQTLMILAIGFFPPTFLISVHIWKDAGLMTAFMMGVSLLLRAKETKRNAYALFSLPFFLYGLAVRHNSILATLPLIFLFSEIYINNSRMIIKTNKLKIGLGAVVLIALLSVSNFFNTYHAKKEDPWGVLIPWDLAAISVYQNKMQMPEYLIIDERDSPQEAFNKIKANFDPHRNFTLDPVIRTLTSPESANHLKRDWYGIVSKNLSAYLHHRWIVSKTLFGFFTKVYYASHNTIDKNRYGFHLYHENSSIYRQILIASASFENTIFYKAWIYLVVSALIAGAATIAGPFRDHAISRESALLAISSFLYAIPLVVLAPCCDFRYNCWLIMGAIMSFLLLVKWTTAIRREDRQNKPGE